jgi:hypothetical protein
MPLPGGGPTVLPPLPPFEESLLLQPPNAAAETNTTAPNATNFEEIEERFIISSPQDRALGGTRAAHI